ncbi:MAG: hypothetical protein LAO55_09140 [Acidobacteriia bacterium]|nr:hypothetical protein [Terriglobia bacterium]
MAEPSNAIRIPKPSRSSFNMDRLLEKNSLLLNQVKHFLELEKTFPPEKRTGTDPKSITTEGRAAEYIRKMTDILHPKTAKSGGR